MRIADRSPSMAAQHILALNQKNLSTELNRIATGHRINAGKDDPAGLVGMLELSREIAASEALDRAAERNMAVANVAEGALAEISTLTTEANALAVAAANSGAMADGELGAMQLQFDSMAQTAGRIFDSASFNGQKLFDGSMNIPSTAGDDIVLPEMSLGTFGAIDVDDGSGGTIGIRFKDVMSGGPVSLGSPNAQATIGAAGLQVAELRGAIGAFQANAIEPSQRNNQVMMENLTAARSVIRDTDFAQATAEIARLGVLGAVSAEALGIANQSPQNAVTLLG